jgi:HAD superfamily hydrolase (TIGR01484 family)
LEIKESLRLIVVDVDGCLTRGEAQPLDFRVLERVAEFNARAQANPAVPAVTLCTGRQEPYVEVLMQAIGAFWPGIYENGGGLYFPQAYRFIENPLISPDTRQALGHVKEILRQEVIEQGLGYLQPGKEVSLSVYPVPSTPLEQLRRVVQQAVRPYAAWYTTDESATCVDVIPVGVNKGTGVRWLSAETGVPLSQIGGVGDSPGDLTFLTLVGLAAAPANATPEVKTHVDYVSPFEDGEGLIDILERCHELSPRSPV